MIVSISPYFPGLFVNLQERVRWCSQIDGLQPYLVVAILTVQDLSLKHDLVNIEAQNRVGGNLEQFLK